MLDLQFGRHSRCAAVAVACQVLAVVGLAGCKKAPSAPSAQEAPPASAPEASSPQAVESAADGSMAPPDEFLRQCMRVQMADGSLRDSSVGVVQVNEFVAVVEGNPNATVTWEQDGDGTYILHDVILDRVKGTEMTVDLKFADFGDAEPSDLCGPRQFAASRVVLNGLELHGYDKVAFIDKLIIKARPE